MADKMDAMVERLASLRYTQVWRLDDSLEGWGGEVSNTERKKYREEARELLAILTPDDLRYLIEREGKWMVVPAPANKPIDARSGGEIDDHPFGPGVDSANRKVYPNG